MISRRHILSGLGYFGLSGLLGRAAVVQADTPQPQPDESAPDLPPHCTALSLVWNTQKKRVRDLEIQHAKTEQSKQKSRVSPEERWWFGAEERRWDVTRHGESGSLDTTHIFNVYYSIKGKYVAYWFVNTSEKSV